MSIESVTGIVASAAGLSRAMASGVDLLRAQLRVTRQQRARLLQSLADRSQSLAEPARQDMPAQDRDVDGRQPWRWPQRERGMSTADDSPHGTAPSSNGSMLDLTG